MHNRIFFFILNLIFFFSIKIINAKKENILKILKNGGEKAEKIKKLLNENKIQDAYALVDEMENKEKENGKIEDNINEDKNKMFDENINQDDIFKIMKFYMYLQTLLNSKIESSEKVMVKKFLRSSIQKMKDNEKNESKKNIDELIKDIEGHQGMLEKLADVIKVDKEHLKDAEIRSKLNSILVGMLKFIDYTKNSSIINSLVDEIEIKEVDSEDGDSKPKLKVNMNDSQKHIEVLQKASNFMGLEIDEDQLKNFTSNSSWYENILNTILNNSDEL